MNEQVEIKQLIALRQQIVLRYEMHLDNYNRAKKNNDFATALKEQGAVCAFESLMVANSLREYIKKS